MIVYHCTTMAAAQAIQEHGFMDGAECYGTEREKAGVVFTDRAADPGDGAAVITIELASEDADSLRRFEWQDPDHRSHGTTWLIPADFANARAVVVGVDVREPEWTAGIHLAWQKGVDTSDRAQCHRS